MIELYLLILIIIFLLLYLYNNKELFTIPENILILNSYPTYIKLKWKKPEGITNFIETDWDYYLEETNKNDNTTVYTNIPIANDVTELNYIIFKLTNPLYFTKTYPITNWIFVLHRIHKNKTESVSSNSVIFSLNETEGEIQYSEANCKTINNNFLENLKGKKINIYI